MKKTNLVFMSLVLAMVLLFAVPSSFAAKGYPNKTITIYCPYSAGGSTDLTSRMIANRATELLGVPVIVVNKTGGGGFIGHSHVFKAKPDGYTLIVNASSSIVKAPHLRKCPYKALEFTPIMSYGMYPFLCAVRADSPIKTINDLVDYAKKNQGKATLSTWSPDAMENLAFYMLEDKENIQFKYVPFEGSAPACAAALGGHVDAYIGTGEAIPHIRAGRMRGLCTMLAERMIGLPDVPTLKEAGYDVYLASRVAIFGPPGLPKEIVEKLQNTFKETMKDKGFLKVAKGFEITPSYLSSSELDAFDRKFYEEIREILIKIGRIKP